jgi:hypothetical protein
MPEERDTLARYSGWGALSRVFDRYPGEWKDTAAELRALVTEEEWEALQASTPNAHYTSLTVVDAMWRAAVRLGLPEDARVLEPALGVGHFFGLQPDHIHGPRTGIELESLSARLARALYPDSAIHSGAFEAYPHLGGYDLVIGNVPFGRYGVRDPHYRAQPVVTRAIHDYFIGRALDEVRPGGLVALITSRYTLDKVDPAGRTETRALARGAGATREGRHRTRRCRSMTLSAAGPTSAPTSSAPCVFRAPLSSAVPEPKSSPTCSSCSAASRAPGAAPNGSRWASSTTTAIASR